MKRYALIVAGGQGLRLGAEIPKQFIFLNGRPLLFYTLEKFHDIVDEIILVLPNAHISYFLELCEKDQFQHRSVITNGGVNRMESVQNGLAAINEECIVAIHDAVRPFASKTLITDLLAAAAEFGNAIPVIPIMESMRFRDKDTNYTVDRTNYVSVQTPQCFDCKKIKEAYQKFGNQTFTDDAGIFEKAGNLIHLSLGETTNIKITYPEDIKFAESLINTGEL